jgi:hypothetical protein
MKDFTYKKISVENYDQILDELKKFCEPLIDSAVSFKHLNIEHFVDQCPLTMLWFTSNNLELRIIALVTTNGITSNVDPHTDTQSLNLALNFPILNCDKSYTSFYKRLSGEKLKRVLPNGIIYTSFINAEYEEIDRVTLDTATVLNTKVPHQVWVTSIGIRSAISFRFTQDPWTLVE